MDALAETLEKLGRPEEARQYSEKAEILWNSQLQEFPEAASGHAIEHFLKWKPQDPRTLELAKKNYELRPGGEASVLLAETYLKNSLPNEAGKVLERTLSSSFKSPELYQVAAEVAEAQGSLDQAGQYRQLARQLNPLL